MTQLVGTTKFIFQVQFALMVSLLIKIVLVKYLFLCLKSIIGFFYFLKF